MALMLRGLPVFALTYALISALKTRFARLDRPAGAMIGAVLAVAAATNTPDEAANAVKLPRLPLLAALATGANTGSVETLVGNHQEMLCGSVKKMHFALFMTHTPPVAIVALGINHGARLVLFRRELDTESAARGLLSISKSRRQ